MNDYHGSIIITASSQFLHTACVCMRTHLYYIDVYVGSQPRRSMYSRESETAWIHAEPPTFTNIYGRREHDAYAAFQLSHMDPVTTPARDSTSPSVRSALRIPVAQSGKRAKPRSQRQGRALLSTAHRWARRWLTNNTVNTHARRPGMHPLLVVMCAETYRHIILTARITD